MGGIRWEGHASVTFTFLIQSRIAFSLHEALAILGLYIGGFRLLQLDLISMFVSKCSDALPGAPHFQMLLHWTPPGKVCGKNEKIFLHLTTLPSPLFPAWKFLLLLLLMLPHLRWSGLKTDGYLHQ